MTRTYSCFQKSCKIMKSKKVDEFITIEEKFDKKDLICETNIDLFFKNLKQ